MESDDVQSPNQSRVNRWWLPTPKVPSGGLSTEARKHLHHQRECVNQILKAALAVNAQTLSEMKVPLTYVDSLPKVRQVVMMKFSFLGQTFMSKSFTNQIRLWPFFLSGFSFHVFLYRMGD